MARELWMAGAVKREGALRKKMGAKEGEKIPIARLQARKRALQAKAKGDKKLSATELRELKQINLALTFRKYKS